MKEFNTQYFIERTEWRQWLEKNFQKEREVWLIYPNKSTGKPKILYNDAVEEALCFGWIDSLIKKYDPVHAMQKYTPRNPKSSFSQPNKERLKWLHANSMIHPEILPKVKSIIEEEFIFPDDIIAQLQQDQEAWQNFQNFSESYKRIRIAYIDTARQQQEEFDKRLQNFLNKTRENKLVGGYGGIDKYY